MALLERRPSPGLIHHSDCGVQYASHAYSEMLKQHGVIISMSRKGNPTTTLLASRVNLIADDLPLQRIYPDRRTPERPDTVFLTQPYGGGNVRDWTWSQAASRSAASPPGSSRRIGNREAG